MCNRKDGQTRTTQNTEQIVLCFVLCAYRKEGPYPCFILKPIVDSQGVVPVSSPTLPLMSKLYWSLEDLRLLNLSNILKAISEYKIRLKSLNVLLRRSYPFVFFVAHVICTLQILKRVTVRTPGPASLTKINSGQP